MLSERRENLLNLIVEEYVESAVPVGSKNIVEKHGVPYSPATVRIEMARLEEEGYIAQPHTSAGRVPSDKGYRYYVDHLAGAGQLPAMERRRIVEFFSSATFAMDQLLAQTSQLLAGVTAHAAVVVGPELQAVVVRAANLVLLQLNCYGFPLSADDVANGPKLQRGLTCELNWQCHRQFNFQTWPHLFVHFRFEQNATN